MWTNCACRMSREVLREGEAVPKKKKIGLFFEKCKRKTVIYITLYQNFFVFLHKNISIKKKNRKE